MKHSLTFLLSVGLLVAALSPSAPARTGAEPAACLMEGEFAFMGQQMVVSDCIQNDGAPHARLVEACDTISKMSTAFGIPAPVTTWRAKCPAAPQGRCLHMGGSKLTAYYYKRPVNELPDVKASCELMGGRYVDR